MSVISHEQEVIGSSALDTLLGDSVPLIRLVLLNSRVR